MNISQQNILVATIVGLGTILLCLETTLLGLESM